MGPLHDLAAAWLPLFALHLVEISLFILLIWALERSVHLSVQLRHAMWLIALLKVFIPPVFTLPAFWPAVPAGDYLLPLVEAGGSGAARAGTWSPALVLFSLWISSVLMIAAWVLLAHLALYRRLAGAQPARVATTPSGLDGLAHFPILETSAIPAPVLAGLRRPKLYLPTDWRAWSADELASVLAHEGAHLRHRDLWVLSAQTLALVLFGLSPCVWLLHARLNHLRELRCDQAALRASGMGAVAYCKFLFTLIARSDPAPHLHPAGNHFSARCHALRRRLQHLLHDKEAEMKSPNWWQWTAVALLVMALVPFSWQCSERPAPVTDTPAQVSTRPSLSDTQVAFDTAPQPVEGMAAIARALKYPESARREGVEGKLLVEVTITAEGEVVDAAVKDSFGNPECDAAALAAVQGLKWQPAQMSGAPVSARITIPVHFRLQADKPGSPAGASAPIDKKTKVAFDEPPQPVGGMAALLQHLKYPERSRKAGSQGTAYIEAVIAASGEVEAARVLDSSGDADCDQAAIAAIGAVKWQPAKLAGQNVKATVTIPVRFRLE